MRRDGNAGALALWLMKGLQVSQAGGLGTVPVNWTIAGTDNKGDIFWREENTGTLAISELYGFEVVQAASLGVVPLNWVVAGTGDFDGNGSTDILWRDNNTGTVAIWLLDGLQFCRPGVLAPSPHDRARSHLCSGLYCDGTGADGCRAFSRGTGADRQGDAARSSPCADRAALPRASEFQPGRIRDRCPAARAPYRPHSRHGLQPHAPGVLLRPSRARGRCADYVGGAS